MLKDTSWNMLSPLAGFSEFSHLIEYDDINIIIWKVFQSFVPLHRFFDKIVSKLSFHDRDSKGEFCALVRRARLASEGEVAGTKHIYLFSLKNSYEDLSQRHFLELCSIMSLLLSSKSYNAFNFRSGSVHGVRFWSNYGFDSYSN